MAVVLDCTLRNGLGARVFQRVGMAFPWGYMGCTLTRSGEMLAEARFMPDMHVWQANGAWRADGAQHGMDIVEFGVLP